MHLNYRDQYRQDERQLVGKHQLHLAAAAERSQRVARCRGAQGRGQRGHRKQVEKDDQIPDKGRLRIQEGAPDDGRCQGDRSQADQGRKKEQSDRSAGRDTGVFDQKLANIVERLKEGRPHPHLHPGRYLSIEPTCDQPGHACEQQAGEHEKLQQCHRGAQGDSSRLIHFADRTAR